MKKEILGEVLSNKILSINAATDRFPTRKFSTSIDAIKDRFDNLHLICPDSIYMLDKVMNCYDLYEQSVVERYNNSYCKDVFQLPTLLGLNTSIKECHNKWVATYDMSKLHNVVLGALLGECPKKVKHGLENYLQSVGISFTKYINFIVNGINSDIFESGFQIFDLLNSFSNSYLTIKRIADTYSISVVELMRLFIIKFNEVVFDDFMGDMENKKKSVLVQSVGLDSLVISSSNINEFLDLEFIYNKNFYCLKADIMLVSEFNSEIAKYYLNRKLVNAC